LQVKDACGFSADESAKLLDYARTNAFLIWELAREACTAVRVESTTIPKT